MLADSAYRRRFENLSKVVRRPMLHLSATMACNLRCSYCTVTKYLLDAPTDSFLQDRTLRDVLSKAPPSHIYLSGGEPLLHPDTIEFVEFLGRLGHVASFDTNLTINASRLEAILDQWNPEWVGYFDISHHLQQSVPIKTMLAATNTLRRRNINHYVKYLGRVADFNLIDDCMARIEDAGSGASLTIQSGRGADGRRLPNEYRVDECIWLLKRMRLRSHAIQVFGGLRMRGHRCKGGAELVVWNRLGNQGADLWPCCHGQSKPIGLTDTVFGNGTRKESLCPFERCSGYTYFSFGTNFVDDEVDDFVKLTLGPKPALELSDTVAYLRSLTDRGYSFVLADLLAGVRSLTDD